jgi:hypothetical protein
VPNPDTSNPTKGIQDFVGAKKEAAGRPGTTTTIRPPVDDRMAAGPMMVTKPLSPRAARYALEAAPGSRHEKGAALQRGAVSENSGKLVISPNSTGFNHNHQDQRHHHHRGTHIKGTIPLRLFAAGSSPSAAERTP